MTSRPRTNGEQRLYLRSDVLFGRLNSVFGFLGVGLLYFTLATWIGKGRTPGKWLLGLGVLRLDGRRVSNLQPSVCGNAGMGTKGDTS